MKSSLAKAATQARSIVHRTRGHSQGSITRLVSPSDVGELIKPFVFLDISTSTRSACRTSAFIRTPASRR